MKFTLKSSYDLHLKAKQKKASFPPPPPPRYRHSIALPSAIYFYPSGQALFQLKFGPVQHCLEWDVSSFMEIIENKWCIYISSAVEQQLLHVCSLVWVSIGEYTAANPGFNINWCAIPALHVLTYHS